jgi:hypothetical protein
MSLFEFVGNIGQFWSTLILQIEIKEIDFKLLEMLICLAGTVSIELDGDYAS